MIVGYQIVGGVFEYLVNDPFGADPYSGGFNPIYGESSPWEASQPQTYTYSEMGLGNANKGLITIASTRDTTPPTISAFSVTPTSLPVGGSVTISYTASDTGGSGLKTAQLWRTPDDGHGVPNPNSWQQVGPSVDISAAGNGPYQGSFQDTPPLVGEWWYGVHVVDGASPSNWNDEANSQSGGVPGVFGPKAVTVSGPDTTPPTPNPSTWATAPYPTGNTSISMTATTASDPSGVQYFFHCLTTGGHDSGWQASATYVDTRLSPNTKYTYQVMTRDNSPNQNQGSYSTPASATTPPVPGPLPNLTPYQPPGWSDKIVVTRQSGSHTDSSPFYTTDSLYVDFAVVNNGTDSTGTGFSTAMYIDGVLLASYGPSFSLAAGSYWNPGSISIGSLGAGTHSVGIVADSTGAIAESNETDNTYTNTITVQVPGPLPNLTPYQPPGWSDKIVVTRQAGSHTDSSPLYTNDSLYVDFAVVNNGTASTETGFSTAMYIDGVLLASYGPSFSLAVGSYWNPGGISIGSLGAGPHSVGIVADSTGAIAESNETDNTYTKTITVTNNPPDTQVTTCAVSGQYLGLCWPTNASGFALESTPTLGPGCSWTSVPQTPIVVGDHYTVTDAVSGTCRFYRLRKP